MQEGHTIIFLGMFCLGIVLFYPVDSIICLKGKADLDSTTKKVPTPPTATEVCDATVTFCATVDSGKCTVYK